MADQTRPSAIVRDEVRDEYVNDCSVAELMTHCIRQLDIERAGISAELSALGEQPQAAVGDDAIAATKRRSDLSYAAREFSLAITHAEDAITRANKGHYRLDGRFAITDAERRST